MKASPKPVDARVPLLVARRPLQPIDGRALVIPRYLIIPGREARNTAHVSDDRWPLHCALGPENVPDHEATINFNLIADPHERRLVQEYLYLTLNFDHFSNPVYPLHAARPSSVPKIGQRLRRLLGDVRRAGLGLHQVDQRWLDEWLAVARATISPSTINHFVICWRRLHVYRDHLSFEIFDVAPWGKKSGSRVAGYKAPRENKTPRIPNAIYAPMMRWCLFLIGEAAGDVIEYRFDKRQHFDRRSQSRNDVSIGAYVAELRANGGKIPIRASGAPSWTRIAKATGLSPGVVRARCDQIRAAAEELGTIKVEHDIVVSMLPDVKVPWVSQFSERDQFQLIRLILAACYFVVGILSGMRDSEVTALRRGCLRELLDKNGKVYRYLVDGLTFKGSDDHAGERHTWVVIEPVAHAIRLAAKLQDVLTDVRSADVPEEKRDLLFMKTVLYDGKNPALTAGTANDYLNDLAAKLNELAHAAAAANPAQSSQILAQFAIPLDEQGQVWRFATRQLRRTLSWYIANEPFGVVAGMLQFGHASAIIFEGYAGSSASGFPDEIAEERALAQCDDILELYDGFREGRRLGGPKGAQLEAEFRQIQLELGDLPAQVVDEERRSKMLASIAVTLHPGFINDCFFYADHALCLKGRAAEDGPVLSQCDPEGCPNSCISWRQQSAISACLTDAREMRSKPKLPPLQTIALDQQIATYERMLAKASL